MAHSRAERVLNTAFGWLLADVPLANIQPFHAEDANQFDQRLPAARFRVRSGQSPDTGLLTEGMESQFRGEPAGLEPLLEGSSGKQAVHAGCAPLKSVFKASSGASSARRWRVRKMSQLMVVNPQMHEM
jgi:hypothetical protein